MRSAVFWTFWTVDITATAVITYFFIEGLGDGTISSTNALLWLGLVMGPATILATAFLLRSYSRIGFANGVLSILAVPSLMFGLLTAILTLGTSSYR